MIRGRMMDFKEISIRGRMAYLLCVFERLLLQYKCRKEDWKILLEKLWKYMNIEYLDDWMYELAEYMPNSVLFDSYASDDCEFITAEEFAFLHNLYNKSCQEIITFLRIIFELGTMEIYERLVNNSSDTIKKLQEGVNIALNEGIELPDKSEFEKYKYSECDG